MIAIGSSSILFLILVYLIFYPDKAEKLKSLILEPTFRLFKWGPRQFLAAKISSMTSDFFNKHIIGYIPSLNEIKFKIKWVKNNMDPVFKNDGTIVLRLRETNDQTLNFLSAAKVAFPNIICSNIRFNIKKYFETSIDLTLLRNFTLKLGKHAQPLFQKHFLSPAIAEVPEIANLFKKLVEIDNKGTFVTVFLEELNLLGDVLFNNADTNDYTEEILSFLNYLLKEANRKIGEDIQLEHITEHFRMAIVLVAKSWKAETKGAGPYLNSIDINLKKGCDSIYIISYPNAFDFLKRILDVLESDNRLTIYKKNRVKIDYDDLTNSSRSSQIVLLRRNKIYDLSTFEEQINSLKIKEGDIVEGNIIDVSETNALVNVLGLNGTIELKELSWRTNFDCRDSFTIGAKEKFIIKTIDKQRNKINLSRRFVENDPILLTSAPKIGAVVNVEVIFESLNHLVTVYNQDLEIIVKKNELSWNELTDAETKELLGKRIDIKISHIDKTNSKFFGSAKILTSDPWPIIHKRFPKGKKINGKIIEIRPDSVIVSIAEGINGYILKDYLVQAGFEYKNFEHNLIPGQGLEVVVDKVFLGRRRIRLNLARNVV